MFTADRPRQPVDADPSVDERPGSDAWHTAPMPEAAVGRANELNAAGRYVEAVAALDEADADAGSAEALTARGWALENLGDPAGARAAYEQALALDPGALWAAEGLANVLRRAGEHQAAEERYRSVIARAQADPSPDTDTLELLGWCLHRLGRDAEAVATFRRALTAEPGHVSIRLDLALALLYLGRSDDALAEYRRGVAAAGRASRAVRAASLRVAADDLREALAERPDLDGAASAPLGLLA
jgi:tetratricopeptide (TPR) repeat protein